MTPSWSIMNVTTPEARCGNRGGGRPFAFSFLRPSAPHAPITLDADRVSFRHQYLAGSAIDVEQPEGCHVLLQNHRDHADAGCKKVVPSVMCMSRTDSALALDAEQDRRERAGRYRYLIGADIGVGAVDCS